MARNTLTRTTLLEAYADLDNAIAHMGHAARAQQAAAAPELLHQIVTDEHAAQLTLIDLAQGLQNLLMEASDLDRDADTAADYIEDALAAL